MTAMKYSPKKDVNILDFFSPTIADGFSVNSKIPKSNERTSDVKIGATQLKRKG